MRNHGNFVRKTQITAKFKQFEACEVCQELKIMLKKFNCTPNFRTTEYSDFFIIGTIPLQKPEIEALLSKKSNFCLKNPRAESVEKKSKFEIL